MGAILRNTMFHHTIKKNHGNTDDMIENYSNTTVKLHGNRRTQEIQSYLNEIRFEKQKIQRYLNDILFEQSLHNFPVQFVVAYIIFIVIYVLLAAMYYKVFHKNHVLFMEPCRNVGFPKVFL